jgi:hypothetical protein
MIGLNASIVNPPCLLKFVGSTATTEYLTGTSTFTIC